MSVLCHGHVIMINVSEAFQIRKTIVASHVSFERTVSTSSFIQIVNPTSLGEAMVKIEVRLVGLSVYLNIFV